MLATLYAVPATSIAYLLSNMLFTYYYSCSNRELLRTLLLPVNLFTLSTENRDRVHIHSISNRACSHITLILVLFLYY